MAASLPDGVALGPVRLRAARLVTPLETIANGAVLIDGPRIVAVGPVASVPLPAGARDLDLGAVTLGPGLVDVHIHGSGGYDAVAGAEAVAAISRYLPCHGVTSWLPTLTPRASLAEMTALIAGALEGRRTEGAEVAGLHLEGPFLSPARPGAIRQEWFHPPSLALLDGLLDAGLGQVRLMTLAPEREGGLDLVRRLVERGVTASIGHSDATAEQVLAAEQAGVRHATHTYNAMRPLHHRDPGVVGVVMVSDRIRGELIADGVHVDPLAMRALIRAKSPHGVMLITDAVSPAGLGDGDYEFDGRPIRVRRGRATLTDGTIAGSVGTADDNLRRIVRECGASLADAFVMGALAPARSVSLADRKGQLAAGRDADIVALDDELRVRLTICRGQVAFSD
ncbi:MAG TPA: N-acetylglucosamine-6-phosphate deacetylase [Chloroflexota bacterium]|nr:N-acetylglucosamine-6-phosphate deacetylase [Chloroflexota bacterium]